MRGWENALVLVTLVIVTTQSNIYAQESVVKAEFADFSKDKVENFIKTIYGKIVQADEERKDTYSLMLIDAYLWGARYVDKAEIEREKIVTKYKDDLNIPAFTYGKEKIVYITQSFALYFFALGDKEKAKSEDDKIRALVSQEDYIAASPDLAE